MNNFNYTISIFLFSLFASFACSEISSHNSNLAQQQKEAGFDTVSLAIVGDLMCHSQQFESAKKDSGYDFKPTFASVKKYLETADFAFGNLETVTAGAALKFTGYPMFNSPVEYLDAAKDAGFDVLTNANNHSLDRGFNGVQKTIEELDKRSILHTGTARTINERNTPLIVRKNETKLGVLAYTYGTNGIRIPEGKEYCVNLIDTIQIKIDIAKSKAAGANAVLVFVHWGIEYQRFGNDTQKMLEGFIHKNGALLVLGSHPHVLQPSSVRNSNLKSGFTIFSLGNFISAQRKQFTDCGIILRMKLIKNIGTGEVSINNVDYIPTFVSTQNGFRILSVSDAIKAINNGDTKNSAYTSSIAEQQRIKEVWTETTSHMNDLNIGFTAKEQ
jgi:poly-gamma-glutamate capsule biosynthesis protein CapA/YwtB (metallophosphatase superfamily)